MLPPKTTRPILVILRAAYEESIKELLKLLIYDTTTTSNVFI